VRDDSLCVSSPIAIFTGQFPIVHVTVSTKLERYNISIKQFFKVVATACYMAGEVHCLACMGWFGGPFALTGHFGGISADRFEEVGQEVLDLWSRSDINCWSAYDYEFGLVVDGSFRNNVRRFFPPQSRAVVDDGPVSKVNRTFPFTSALLTEIKAKVEAFLCGFGRLRRRLGVADVHFLRQTSDGEGCFDFHVDRHRPLTASLSFVLCMFDTQTGETVDSTESGGVLYRPDGVNGPVVSHITLLLTVSLNRRLRPCVAPATPLSFAVPIASTRHNRLPRT
jgi:hypothetical protein